MKTGGLPPLFGKFYKDLTNITLAIQDFCATIETAYRKDVAQMNDRNVTVESVDIDDMIFEECDVISSDR